MKPLRSCSVISGIVQHQDLESQAKLRKVEEDAFLVVGCGSETEAVESGSAIIPRRVPSATRSVGRPDIKLVELW